jgi:hypothetical protein
VSEDGNRGFWHAAAGGWFLAWAAVGCVGALGLVSLGPAALVAAAAVGLLLARVPLARRSASGLLAGAGLVSLLVAYVQRDGPGVTCWHTVSAAGCDQHLNPVPWLVIGIACVTVAVVTQSRHARTSS